jgi:hypothetical protein
MCCITLKLLPFSLGDTSQVRLVEVAVGFYVGTPADLIEQRYTDFNLLFYFIFMTA